MYAYEISYRENGICKFKGFKYKDQFDKAIARLSKKANVEILQKNINVAQ